MGNYTQRAMNGLTAEYEVSEVLEHFNSQYIFDVITEKISNRFNLSMIMSASNPNIVLAFEDNFKRCMAVYPADINNIKEVREETYEEIVDIIAKAYGFTVNFIEGIDMYWYAYQLYDFFVCNYANYIATFFAKYIYNNRVDIYNAFNLDAVKKVKEGAIAYGKKVFNDSKLAVILTNIVYVVNGMVSFDITFETILNYIYGNINIVQPLLASLTFPYDVYKQLFYNSVSPDYQPMLITNIRLALQQYGERANSTDITG